MMFKNDRLKTIDIGLSLPFDKQTGKITRNPALTNIPFCSYNQAA